jgi:hypothetical protein
MLHCDMPRANAARTSCCNAGRRRLSAAQPSGLRCQALPRPRCRLIEMAAPVRGRGDARPPACAGPSASRAPAGAAPQIAGDSDLASFANPSDWGLASPRIAPCSGRRRKRQPRFEAMPGTATRRPNISPAQHHKTGNMATPVGRAAFGVAVPGIASSAMQAHRNGDTCARTRRCQAPACAGPLCEQGPCGCGPANRERFGRGIFREPFASSPLAPATPRARSRTCCPWARPGW